MCDASVRRMTAAIYGDDATDRVGHPTGSMPGSVRAWCEIDGDALRANAHWLRARAGVPLVPMVKADAYGLGAVAVARALGAPFMATGTDANAPTKANATTNASSPPHAVPWALGVATIDEAEALRAAGATGRVLCTTPVLPDELPRLAAARVRPALHSADSVQRWRAIAPDLPWHLAIDTGMERAGVRWDRVAPLAEVLAEHPPEGVCTHFHSADVDDASRREQEARFDEALRSLPLPTDVLRHADNSWGVLARSPSPFDLVRPGYALYAGPAAHQELRTVLHVRARIVDLRDVPVGATVSYGATWTAARPTRVATIGLGYGDGLRRALSNRATLRLHGRPVPVIGAVTMDLTMLDVTDVPCALGDVVTVLGEDGQGGAVGLGELAAAGDLSAYELLVGWRLRLPRVYRP